MSFEDMLNDECDVYRLELTSTGSMYNVPSHHNQVKHSYPEEPMTVKVPCHFEEQNQSIVQGDPANAFSQVMRITFFSDADIKMHDAVDWEGSRYILQKPKNVRDHHQIVIGIRSENL